ncbi:MAG: hypothetical protein KJO98_11830 [Rhodothermia bacterium]|nr:hypothetical protein [Rhodothermia bacterium]
MSAAAFVVALSFSSASGQNLHPEFEIRSGSSLRAGLLYGSLAEGELAQAPSTNQPEDPWIAFDKAEHVTFGFLFTLGTQYVLVNKLSTRERRALPFSVGVAATAGLGKELYDLKYGSGYFSRRDLIADAAGIALAVVVVLL